jgi:hypothetical protein
MTKAIQRSLETLRACPGVEVRETPRPGKVTIITIVYQGKKILAGGPCSDLIAMAQGIIMGQAKPL